MYVLSFVFVVEVRFELSVGCKNESSRARAVRCTF